MRTFTTTFGRSEDSSIGSPALRRDLLLRWDSDSASEFFLLFDFLRGSTGGRSGA